MTEALHLEITALQDLGLNNIEIELAADGWQARWPRAFGCAHSASDVRAPAQDYFFYIEPIEGDRQLRLVVDGYGAARGPDADDATFDADAWDAGKVILQTAACREGFRELSKIGRALLKGRGVVLPDGDIAKLAHFVEGGRA